MKKRTALTLSLLLCAALILSACGGKPEASVDPTKLENETIRGNWLHTGGTTELFFDGERSFSFTGDKGSSEGAYAFDGENFILEPSEGKPMSGSMDAAGNLAVSGMDGYFYPGEPVPDMSLAGKWIYNFHDIFLTFDDEGRVSYETPKHSGEYDYFFDGHELTLSEGEKEIGKAVLNERNRLEFEGLNGCFYPEGESEYVPLSEAEAVKFQPNCEVGAERHTLADSAAFYNTETKAYAAVDADWAVLSDEVDVTDGYRTVTAVVSCYIPYANVPSMEGPAHCTCAQYFYDKYTGLVVTPSEFYEIDDNNYVFCFDSEGGRVIMTYAYEEKYSGPYGDCIDIMSCLMTFRFPEWYDGLMIAGIPQPDSLEQCLEYQEKPERPLGVMITSGSGTQTEYGLRFNIK